jgi:ribokinase
LGAIAIVGSVNRDLHLTVENLPGPGETVLAEGMAVTTGGKGANQALAVVAAHGSCHLVAAVGDDSAGAAILETLRAQGVDTAQLHQLTGSPTGTAVVTVNSHGENNIVVASGANLALTADQVGTSLRAIPDVTTVLTQCEVSPEVVAAAADHARASGARFILNLAPYRGTDLSILKQCDPLVVNEVEAAAMATELELDIDDLGELALGLAELCQSVVITAGADGAWCARGSTATSVPAPVTEVVDTTGAGDAFVGALTAFLDRTDDLVQACRAGVEAGSRAVQHRGAQP